MRPPVSFLRSEKNGRRLLSFKWQYRKVWKISYSLLYSKNFKERVVRGAVFSARETSPVNCTTHFPSLAARPTTPLACFPVVEWVEFLIKLKKTPLTLSTTHGWEKKCRTWNNPPKQYQCSMHAFIQVTEDHCQINGVLIRHTRQIYCQRFSWGFQSCCHSFLTCW